MDEQKKNELIFYVYEYWDISVIPNIPIYVGKGHNMRAWSHLKISTNRRLHYKIQNLLMSGLQPDVRIIQEGLSHTESCALEREKILEYGRCDIKTGTLYNLTEGGEGTYGRICSYETRMIFSTQRKGRKRTDAQKEAFKHRKPLTLEQRQQKIQHLNDIRIKSHTDEINRKRVISRSWYSPSDDTKNKWSKQRKGKGPCKLALERVAHYQAQFNLSNTYWNNWHVYMKDVYTTKTGTRYFCLCVDCGYIKSILRDSIIKRRNVECDCCVGF